MVLSSHRHSSCSYRVSDSIQPFCPYSRDIPEDKCVRNPYGLWHIYMACGMIIQYIILNVNQFRHSWILFTLAYIISISHITQDIYAIHMCILSTVAYAYVNKSQSDWLRVIPIPLTEHMLYSIYVIWTFCCMHCNIIYESNNWKY